MLAKLLAAALSSCCLAIPVTFKVQGLFEQCRSHVLWRSDGMRRTLDLRHKTPQTLNPVRRSALSLRLRSSQADFRGRQAAPGGPRLVGSFQSWNIPSAVATRQQDFLLCALCVWSAEGRILGVSNCKFQPVHEGFGRRRRRWNLCSFACSCRVLPYARLSRCVAPPPGSNAGFACRVLREPCLKGCPGGSYACCLQTFGG